MQVFDAEDEIILFSATKYPRSGKEALDMGLSERCKAEMRAMTIAAFRVAQNNTQISVTPMSASVLTFLLADSRSAIKHWMRVSRLDRSGGTFSLTAGGLVEVQKSLRGEAGAYSTTEDLVVAWQQRMIHGDTVASRHTVFPLTAWPC